MVPDKCTNARGSTCVQICVGMCADMCVDMCADMCIDMCAGVCVDMCVDMCVGLPLKELLGTAGADGDEIVVLLECLGVELSEDVLVSGTCV